MILDVEDDYYSLPAKVQKMFQWGLTQGYDQVLKVDDDVFLYVGRLLQNLDDSDYRGYEVEAANGEYVSGTAYWVSRRAMDIVAAAQWLPLNWAEDKWVGSVLAKHSIPITNDERFHCCHCDDCQARFPESQRISSHTIHPRRLYELMNGDL